MPTLATADVVLLVSLAVGSAWVLVCWAASARKPALDAVNDKPAPWDFGKAWATNIAVFGGLLGPALTLLKGSSGPGEPPTLGTELASLAILFSFLATMAVAIYAGWDRGTNLRAPLWVFLVCCALTLGASFGQIGTIFLLSRDALGPDPPVALPQLVGAVYILLCILAFLVVFRSAIDLPMLIRQHSDPLPPKDEEAARAARRWSLL